MIIIIIIIIIIKFVSLKTTSQGTFKNNNKAAGVARLEKALTASHQ